MISSSTALRIAFALLAVTSIAGMIATDVYIVMELPKNNYIDITMMIFLVLLLSAGFLVLAYWCAMIAYLGGLGG